ncbi:MAG: hypothetical protein ACLR1G_03465 [Alistipes indistinctus]
MTGDRVQDATVANAKTTSRQTYGASVGGPIIKNKLFFFINGELEYKSFLGNQWQPSTDGVGSAENKISQTTIADLEKVSDYLQKHTVIIPAHTRISATRLRTTTKSWPASTGTSARTTS